MKRNYLYYLLVVMLLVASCEKDPLAETTDIETQEITSIAATTAIGGGHISSDGRPTIKECGVEWCTTNDFKSEIFNCAAEKAKVGDFTCEITDLNDATTYYVRSYAKNNYGTIYGPIVSFTTLEIVLPTVATSAVTDITVGSATVGGEVTNDGNAEVTERGVVYATSQNPTIENYKVVSDSGLGVFTCQLTGLQDGVTYYVRAYALNSKGVAYGEEKSFTTTAIVLPTVTTSAVTDITISSATVGGEVTNDGNAEVTERGVVYSTNQNPTIDDSKVSSGNGLGLFTCQLTGLQDGVTYYVRAYALNSKGVAYGEEKSFTTTAIVLPTVTTSAVTDITVSSVTVGGEVTADGNAEVTERGVVYSTNQNPTIGDRKVSSGNGLGAFTCQLTGLQDGVTYYVRAYALNSKGVAYGEEKSFTTKVIVLPTVTTSAVTDITASSVTVGGEVTADGNAEVTERGVVYATSQNPAIDDSKVSSGNGLGAFTCQLTGLQDGVTYYVRAYALNSKGVAYGEEKSFTTTAIVLPTVTTSAVMDITAISATVGGEVTNDGNAEVTERGVVYSTNQNPTIDDSKVSSGNGLGLFTCQLTGLQVGVTYYVRAYAVNQKGIAYGEEVTFTTKYKYFSVSSSKQIVFSPGNLQYHPANKKWRFAPSQIDYIGEANINISTSYNGWLDLFAWGTGANPTDTSTNANNYQTFVDWGTNQIGSDAPNTWRTLTADEWEYLLEYRNNASSLKGVANVNGVNGLIFLPDNWTCPSGVTFKSGFYGYKTEEAYSRYQTFSADQWSKLEAAGAVFLPAAGRRCNWRLSYVQDLGYYWSTTESEYNGGVSVAYSLIFGADEAIKGGAYRDYGQSVRLVKDL